ncbi:cation diffusion facilitator family transporter [Elizabethkingia meningoseptica]|uniref:cation diffusion facilitator family transporter n=1 Tax=Elizabethkingia meningoseptica TaxID=238 RepID=UPI0008415E80|nr:cation diffusion facilitator family transporter [Elizabethkingia meningoseptica]EJK5327374.1 cation transporter [Elizabethkingia meningoseptica]MDE5429827.1 cation diffusion facilitator family transporter [Elizabethkingia meningoseptica]MDE5467009.1 cation diffusion facilitator family transporter [Elizabethkingia meningoseptica]MDE5473761.1 cation diffusion facilitator family transporter [Elizabethkingia meningoseptica]MDE5477194.1 cation diffusion facilitator family transporter [Elizabethk
MSTTPTQTVSASSKHKKNLLIVLSFSATYLIAEVVGGILTNSLALLADAAHMLTDVVGLLLAFIAIKIGERKANADKTFGYYRTEILAAVINAVVLLGISVYVLYEAYQRFQNPPEVQSKSMLIVAGIGLLVNIAGMLILRKDSGASLNMKGAYFEVLSDMLTSVGVMIAGVIMLTTGWYYADPLISAGIGLLIIPRTLRLLMEAIHVLLEGTPKDVDIQELRQSLAQIPGVKDLHDLHVWSLTSGVNAMSAHIISDQSIPHNQLLRILTDQATRNFKISHTTFQIEDEGYEEEITHL